jgi:hypothetical protein
MSWRVFTRSMAIARESQIPTLNFFGGEPVLNPLFFPMLESTYASGLSLILATNCRPLASEAVFTRFLEVTREHREGTTIVTARDGFHLRFFDPAHVIDRLRGEGYRVVVNDYSDRTVALSPYNGANQELQKLDTRFSCCAGNPTDYLGVLPNGGWTICPASIESFGNIFSNSMPDILEFKRGLALRYCEGCTECLKDFTGFRKELESCWLAAPVERGVI